MSDVINFYRVSDDFGCFSDWGDGGDGRGKNMLGRILMEIREELVGDSKDE